MCPACTESATVIVAGVASTGGILAACVGKLKNYFRRSTLPHVSPQANALPSTTLTDAQQH